MKKFILKLSIWVLVLFLFTFLVLLPLKPNLFADKKLAFLVQQPNTSLDLLIMGSSRAEHGVDPTKFKKELNVFNMGKDGHGIPSNYFLLKLLLEKHKVKINHLLLQVDEFSLNGSKGFSSKFRDDYFVDELNDPELFEAYKQYRGRILAYTLKKFPQLGNLVYGDFMKLLKNYPYAFRQYSQSLSESYSQSLQSFIQSRGYAPIYQIKNIGKKSAATNYVLEEDDLAYFHKIVELCRKHRVKLSLFRAPILYCEKYQSRAIDSFLTDFTQKTGIPFFDYKCQYQFEQGYFDNTHAVDSISVSMTKDLAARLQLN